MKKHLCVLSTPRSGTTALLNNVLYPAMLRKECSLIGSNLNEYFDPQLSFENLDAVPISNGGSIIADQFDDKLSDLMSSPRRHVIKVFPWHLLPSGMSRRRAAGVAVKRMRRIAEIADVIILERRNMLAQIASDAAAQAANIWHSTLDKIMPAPTELMEITHSQIHYWFWQNAVVFGDMVSVCPKPIAQLVYEDIADDLSQVVGLLGLPAGQQHEYFIRNPVDWVNYISNSDVLSCWIADFRTDFANGKFRYPDELQ